MVIVGVSISVCVIVAVTVDVSVGVTDVCAVQAGGGVQIATGESNTLLFSFTSVIFEVESTVITELFGHDVPGKNTVLVTPVEIAPVTCCVPCPAIDISTGPTALMAPIFLITTLVPTLPSSPLRQVCGNSSCVITLKTTRSTPTGVWLPVGVIDGVVVEIYNVGVEV